MNNKLNSGELYTLSSILNGDNDKVVIPDLQRDYCWGNSDNDLVNKFLESLYELEWDKEITLGLIYGYTNELAPNHIQLCDGQQRITTLFLLIGALNKRLNNKYRSFLISDWEEQNDDKEPYLQYAIRESSLYFLSDLTCNHFLSDNLITPTQIKEQPWFLQSYSLDPTIESILCALSTIEDWLNNKFQTSTQLEQFSEFILYRVKFLYHDMDNRENGEETFVVINTTGEPLSTIQNLKPRIIEANHDNGDSIARTWETMETWFWQNRHMNDKDTADEGMLAFLHCVRILQAESEQEWYHLMETDDDFPLSISMDTIWNWFGIYKRIHQIDYSRLRDSNITYPDNQCHFAQKQLFSILPTMCYANAHPGATTIDIQRVYHLFSNMSRYRTTTRSSQNESLNVPAYRNCQLIRLLKSNDIVEFSNIPDFDIEEELAKLRYIASQPADARERLEEVFAKAESFNIFDGKISILLSWSNGAQECLESLCEKVELLWITNQNINHVRRALLAFDENQDFYPMPTTSVNYTLCDKTEWRDLFENNSELMYRFINENHNQLILNYQNTDSEFYPVIKDDSLIEFAQGHNVRIYKRGSKTILIELLKKERESSDFILIHQGCVFHKSLLGNEWNSLWAWGDGENVTIYTPCKELNITIDLLLKNDKYQFIAHIDRAPHKKAVSEDILINYGFKYTEGFWRYTDIENISQAKDKLIELSKYIISRG